MIKHVIALFLFIVLMGCQAESTKNHEQPKTSQTTKLRAALESLNLEHPAIDADKNIRNGNLQFVCVCGYACYNPGVEQKDDLVTKKYGAKCLEGTSDVIEGEEHGKLIYTAIKYAEIYNQLPKAFAECPAACRVG